MIRPANIKDASAIARIYNHYILNTVVTFEEEAVTDEEIGNRIQDITAKYPWLVCEIENKVVAYAYASAWKSRCAYRYAVESSVYVEKNYVGKGIGREIYAVLIRQISSLGMRTVIGGATLPNKGSVNLHEQMGFKKVAHFEKVGFKFNQWLDVGYWELVLEVRDGGL